jgi:hypothetical protein
MLRTPRRRPASAPIPRNSLPRERRHSSQFQFRTTIARRVPTTTLTFSNTTAGPTRLDAQNAQPRRSKFAGQHVQRSLGIHFPSTQQVNNSAGDECLKNSCCCCEYSPATTTATARNASHQRRGQIDQGQGEAAEAKERD